MKCYNLKQIIEIQKKVETVNGNGARSIVWEKRCTARAQVRALSGSQRLMSDRLENPVSYKMVIRFKEISPSDRVLYKGRQFNIIHIIDIEEKRKYLELSLNTGVAA